VIGHYPRPLVRRVDSWFRAGFHAWGEGVAAHAHANLTQPNLA